MKRFLSMFMSIVMLLSITAGINITANAEDNGTKTIASATLTPVKPYEIYEGAYGGYDDGGDGYYWAPDFNKDDKIDIVFTDGTTDTFIYDGWDFCNKNDAFLFLTSCSFYFDGLGETTACYQIEGCDDYEISDYYEVSTTVNIVENPVESFTLFSVKSYEIIENTHGYYNEQSNCWTYAPIKFFNEKDAITVYFKDGTTRTFIFDHKRGVFFNEDELLEVKAFEFSFEGTGDTTFKLQLCDYGKPIDVPVTIIESPVESFTLTPAKPYEIVENTNGRAQGETWKYWAPDFNEGDVISINYTNGTTDTFSYNGWNFYNKNNEYLGVYEFDFEFTGTGKTTFVVELPDYGKSIDVTVTIIETPVESFTLTPAKPYEIFENTKGYSCDEGWKYNSPFGDEGGREDDVITVKYTDGTIELFTGDEEGTFYNNEGDYLRVESSSFVFNGTGETTFKVTLCDYGNSIDVPVTIIENPVESFTLKPVKPYEIVENTNGWFDEDNRWYYESPDFNNGDEITVYYTNGTNDTFTYDEWGFYNKNGEYLRVDRYAFEFTGTGKTTFVVELADYEKSIDVLVTIIESPVESFTLKPVKPYEIVENTNGWFDEDNRWYYESPDFNNGDEITVYYTNGTNDTFTYDEWGFYNKNGEYLRVDRYAFEFTGTGKTTFVVELADYGKSIEVPVKIVAASNTGGGGSVGGGGGGGFIPAPTPEEPATTEPTTQPSTKPSAPATTTTKKPSTVKVEKVTKGTKSFKVTWKNKTGVSGYQVQYATDKKFKKNKKTATISKKNATSKTIKKLKSKKTYYVRVRTYKIVNGKKVYSSWSKVKAVKTK